MADPLEYQKTLAKLIFNSPDDAAVRALNRVQDPTYEQGGVVYQDKNGFYSFSEPQGNQRTGKFEAEVKIPKSAKPVAIYHTHPGYGDAAEFAENFSPDDLKMAHQLKLLSYIRAMDSGNIKKFEPGKTKTDAVGFGVHKGKFSPGDLIYAEAK